MRIYNSFRHTREVLQREFLQHSYEIRAPRWQGVDISSKPEMAMRELLNVSFEVNLKTEDLVHWAIDTGSNQPFADQHFAERIGGKPTNPGEAWKIWPWGHRAADHLSEGKFTHTYQQRMWPKFAESETPRRGIYFEYADLNDLVLHLLKDPLSRQAFFPIWHPEDGTCEGRRPCTIGWHFILRHDFFHHTYYIRSCDFTRHFNDDCYFAVRLHLWVLDQLRERDERWNEVKPGLFTMHIISLHMFKNDYEKLRRQPVP